MFRLRLVPEIETNTHSGLQTALLTSKFGMMPDEALQAFRDYQRFGLSKSVRRSSAHRLAKSGRRAVCRGVENAFRKSRNRFMKKPA